MDMVAVPLPLGPVVKCLVADAAVNRLLYGVKQLAKL